MMNILSLFPVVRASLTSVVAVVNTRDIRSVVNVTRKSFVRFKGKRVYLDTSLCRSRMASLNYWKCRVFGILRRFVELPPELFVVAVLG